MTDMRVRQIALVAKELEPALAQLGEVFGLRVGFKGPGEGGFGLINAVMPVGGEFVEVVQPVREDVSAARYLIRRGGDSGYMVILQTADALAHRARLAAMGVRLIAEGHHGGYIFTHFHPSDCAGVLCSTYTVENNATWREPLSDWPPAGNDWRNFPPDGALGIAAVDIQSRDPKAAAALWSSLFETPVSSNGTELKFTRGLVRFVPSRDASGTGVIGLDIKVKDPTASLDAAHKLALPEKDGAVLICGTWMRPVKA